jgi:D-glycero-D-manno-heptose 1,7-bisphosphate phosphatase
MKIVFLDRDGVINTFPGDGNYVTRVKDFHFIPGSLDAIRVLTEEGFTIFVVSNQAGVGRGIYSQKKLDQITSYMLRHVKQARGKIKKVFYCTHRSDQGCGCRKPEIGSLEKALEMMKKPLSHVQESYFVGDTGSDILAGRNAGCKTIFVLSGRGNHDKIRKWSVKPDYIVKDLTEATKLIQDENSRHSRLGRGRSSKSRRSSR